MSRKLWWQIVMVDLLFKTSCNNAQFISMPYHIFFLIFFYECLLDVCKFYYWYNKFCTWTKRLKWIDSGNNNVKIGSHNDNFANKRLVTFYGLKEFLRRRLVIKPFKCSISPSHISVCFSYSYDCKDQTNIIMTNMCFVECF